MDKRLKHINVLLGDYSRGKFDKKFIPSEKLDAIDAIATGINMLGEELKAVTISRNYFTGFFNSVSDMVFLLDHQGAIVDANQSAEQQLNYQKGVLVGKFFNEFYQGTGHQFKRIFKKSANKNSASYSGIFNRNGGGRIPVRIRLTQFQDPAHPNCKLVTATDISLEVKSENIIIRAIIDTQEKERQRLAKDLHDSLNQQLSAIIFYLGSTMSETQNKKVQLLLHKSRESLNDVILEMRNICFNLMPKTLEEFGLFKAVQEFSSKFVMHRKPIFTLLKAGEEQPLSAELEIDLYRVIQEFITNAINHGKAGQIKVSFKYYKSFLKITLKDNGIGFKLDGCITGMGLQNVYSRVKSHYGELKISSKIARGTSYLITIPLSKDNE